MASAYTFPHADEHESHRHGQTNGYNVPSIHTSHYDSSIDDTIRSQSYAHPQSHSHTHSHSHLDAHTHSHSHLDAHAHSHAQPRNHSHPSPYTNYALPDLHNHDHSHQAHGPSAAHSHSHSHDHHSTALYSFAFLPVAYFCATIYQQSRVHTIDTLTPTATHPSRPPTALESTVRIGIVVSGSLLLAGAYARFYVEARPSYSHARKRSRSNPKHAPRHQQSLWLTALLTLGVFTLPHLALVQLNGVRVTLLIILLSSRLGQASLIDSFTSRPWTSAIVLLSMLVDLFGLSTASQIPSILVAYLAIFSSYILSRQLNHASTDGAPSLKSTPHLVAGAFSAAVTLGMYMSTSTPFLFSTFSCIFLLGAIIANAAALQHATVRNMSIQNNTYQIYSFSLLVFLGICLPSSSLARISTTSVTALAYVATRREHKSTAAHHLNAHHSSPHAHHKHDAPGGQNVSVLTKTLLSRVQPGSLLHGILAEKDSRRIAYFTCLNFAFMVVQAFYGWASGSLGLLSDTVHMFFDCLALIVGLGASVASKWPTNPDKPYGWAKLNTLAGFGNGIFLMLVSVEFVWEAIEGIMEGNELRRVQELLVVSTLGLLVNMVGLLAFGHAHAGHDHGHSHGHGHGHSHKHDDQSGQQHDHSGVNGSLYAPATDMTPATGGHGSHSHDNDNMHGIYLHIAADAGGSLAVILSTTLTLWKPWFLWDPLATILIAMLIFAAALPLVTSSARKLLLVIPDDMEYGIKNALQELTSIKGVIGYAVPRFWLEDMAEDHHGHAHAHGHSHDDGHYDHHKRKHSPAIASDHTSCDTHSHGHNHNHNHDHEHNHDHHKHSHNDTSGHVHDHGHDHDHDHGDGHGHVHGSGEHNHSKQCKVLGVIHVYSSRIANTEEVREQTVHFFADRNMDVVVQIEREGDGRCWCGNGVKS